MLSWFRRLGCNTRWSRRIQCLDRYSWCRQCGYCRVFVGSDVALDGVDVTNALTGTVDVGNVDVVVVLLVWMLH